MSMIQDTMKYNVKVCQLKFKKITVRYHRLAETVYYSVASLFNGSLLSADTVLNKYIKPQIMIEWSAFSVPWETVVTVSQQ